MSYPVRTQARALIVHSDQIALVRIQRNGLERWVLPGGGQSAGETLQDTVQRECLEEVGLTVAVGPLCLVREFVPMNHAVGRAPFSAHCIDFVFRCTVIGSAAFGHASQPDDEALESRWIDSAHAQALPLYPECLALWLPRLLTEDHTHYVGDAL